MAERILITGARAAAAVDLARDFAAAGYEVHMADCAPARVARWSRAVARLHAYASPVRAPEAFRAAVAALDEALRPALIVPACEEVFHFAALGLGSRLFAPPAPILQQLHDKAAFARLCLSLDLPVPETHSVEAAEHLRPFAATAEDWVFKARFGRFGQSTSVGALPPVVDGVVSGWVAQRRIRGREASLYAVAREGRLTAFAAYDSQWRLPGGASLSFDPLAPELAGRLQDLASRLASGLALTGQFGCDVMIDQAGEPWLIECNPRATSGAHLLVGDGHLARAIAGSTDTLVIASAGQGLHLLPALATFGLGLALRDHRLPAWWARISGGRDVAGRPGDRRPMLGAVVDGLGFALTAARSGVSTAAATTVDIEWNGDRLS